MCASVYQPPHTKRGRRKKLRLVSTTPSQHIYHPLGNDHSSEIVILTHDELEALKLKSINKMGIIAGAQAMGISKSTFATTYNTAVQKLTESIIHGKTLYIDALQQQWFTEPII